MLRKNEFAQENYYHIYNRGTEKRNIFLNENDYLRFIVLLYLCNNTEPVVLKDLLTQGRSLGDIFHIKRKETIINIGSYCLMPNHFHLLLKEKKEDGIVNFMRKAGTAYSMYFNKKNERTGRLFESTFKANLVDSDEYLKYLFAYINLNPVKLIEPEWKERGIMDTDSANDFLNNYQWSSYGYYTGQKQTDFILAPKEFPEYFENNKEFKDFIEDWLNYKNLSSQGLSLGIL